MPRPQLEIRMANVAGTGENLNLPLRNVPSTLPPSHLQFLEQALGLLAADVRIAGVAVAGSFADNEMDEYSDLDLIIAVEKSHAEKIMLERIDIARSLGNLLVAFTGEHVGEPRLLICLYGGYLTGPLHVDLKFISVTEAGPRVDDPIVVWERDGRLSAALGSSSAFYPLPDAQWIEDRFWVWVHYAAAKIGRGEHFEALDFLSFLRTTVLSPLALKAVGERPSGVRKIEHRAPHLARELESTIATNDPTSLVSGLRAAIAIYRKYRATSGLTNQHTAEEESLRYLDMIEARVRINGA